MGAECARTAHEPAEPQQAMGGAQRDAKDPVGERGRSINAGPDSLCRV